MSARRRVKVSPITAITLSPKSGLPDPDPIRSLTVLCTLIAVLSGCAHADTPGQQFRRIMTDIDRECRERQLGPYEPEPRKTGIRNSSCDILFLKPYDPLATKEGRFAHSIQLPSPYDKAKDVYKPGMTSEAYFKALCEAEAGEFIFKTVENVTGIHEMRPAQNPDDYQLMHLYANEGPTGDQIGDFGRYIGQALVQPNTGRYQFLETLWPIEMSSPTSKRYLRYYRDGSATPGRTISSKNAKGQWERVPNYLASKGVDSLQSQFGYTWRGITRFNDRELGIAGGEMIAMNLTNNEVFGFRRIFRRTGFVIGRTNIWWLTAEHCSEELAAPAGALLYKIFKPVETNRK